MWVFYREAVVAVDRHLEKETEEFLPQKQSRLYGIATTTTQCPQGTTSQSQRGVTEKGEETRDQRKMKR